MSRPIANSGFYGKIPSHGDFVSRLLPRQFIGPWDHWLQASLLASREQLGPAWLDTYLVSPIWQFALSAGVCGDQAWAGIIMPSVDKVGRYFPLTVATPIPDNQLTWVFSKQCPWFEAATQLALSALGFDFNFDKFTQQLEQLALTMPPLCQPATLPDAAATNDSPLDGAKAFKFVWSADADVQSALDSLPPQFMGHASIWRTFQTDTAVPVLLACQGLPPIDSYQGFLNQDWPQHSWDLSMVTVPGKPSAATVEPLPSDDDTVPVRRIRDSNTEAIDQLTRIEAELPRFTATNSTITKQSCAISVVGLRRKLNEDAVLDRCQDGLWAVADGMGGHSSGEVASQALVRALAAVPATDDLEHFSEQVGASLHKVNRDLLQLAHQRGGGQIIGSTIVVLLIVGHQFQYLWAGDSRLYRYRQGVLEQLTLDHSLYNEAIRQGLPPTDGSLEQGRGNIITRAIGAELNLLIDCGQGQVQPGDLFLLCSDGLDKELAHDEIAACCQTGIASEIASRLIQQAEARGGRDNISVVVVNIP